MRECPKCGFRDGIYWWPRVFEPGVDFARFPDVERMNPALGAKLKELTWGVSKSFLTDGPYVYKVTKSGVVHRVEKFLFDAQDGFSVGTDGAGSPFSSAYKKKISGKETRRLKETIEHGINRRYSWIRAALAKEQSKLSWEQNK